MLLYLYFINFCLSALVPYPVPYANLPSGAPLPTNLTGIEVLIVGGLEGIAQADAEAFYSRGASVSITTRDLDNVMNLSLPYRVFELEFGRSGSVDRFISKYMKKVGRIPDILVDVGQQWFIGLMLDFNRTMLMYAMQMYIIDPLMLIQGFLQYNDVSRPFNITFALSSAAFAAVHFEEYYSAGKKLKMDFVKNFRLYEGPKYYPNVRVSGVLCAYTNTNYVANSFNPSAARGDPLMTAYPEIVQYIENALNYSAANVALAHLEASTTLTPSNNSLYLVNTTVSTRTGTEVLYNVYVNDDTQTYNADYLAFFASVGLNITAFL